MLGRETAIQKVYWTEDGWLRLAKTDFPKAFFNSIFLTVVSECLIILIIPMGAYGIARTKNKLSTAIYTFFLAGMMIPFQAYMVALFRELNTVGSFRRASPYFGRTAR